MRIKRKYISCLPATAGLCAIGFVLIFEALAIISANAVVRRERTKDNKVCGKVITSANVTVDLVEDSNLSEEMFEKVHVKKLQNARFIPGADCSIQVCGFTSYGTTINESYIGTTSDYSDCKVFTSEAIAPDQIYNSLYNLSSISCGCLKDSKDCSYNCEDRATTLASLWKGNECAVLFQESGCNSCYLRPLTLSNGQNYSTDNAHTFRSIVVRDHCVTRQSIPALKRMYRFADIPQPIVYAAENNSQSNVKSAFQSDPEYFYCECDSSPVPFDTTTSTSTESPPPPEPPHNHPTSLTAAEIILIAVATGLILTVSVGFVIWKKRNVIFHRSSDTDITEYSVMPSSTPSSLTSSTISGDINNDQLLELGDSQILNRPLDVAFDINPKHVTIRNSLAEGNFGQVHEGSLQVAIKRVKLDCDSKKKKASERSLYQEIKILAHIGVHENVVRLLGYSISSIDEGPVELILITELCQNGSLQSYLEKEVKPKIFQKLSKLAMEKLQMGDDGHRDTTYISSHNQADTEETKEEVDLETVYPEMLLKFYRWIFQIASGMEYIQSRKVIHIDLATRNVLLTHKLVAKIGDFGLSLKTYIKNYVHAKETSLPLRWVSPEALENYRCSTKSDVWSFGAKNRTYLGHSHLMHTCILHIPQVTIWEIFNLGLKIPYDNLSDIQVFPFIISGRQLECPDYAPRELYEYFRKCWERNPDNRPSFEDLKSYFKIKLEKMQETTELEQGDEKETTVSNNVEGTIPVMDTIQNAY